MFIPRIYDGGQPAPWELQPAGASLAAKVGMALYLASGVLAKATATQKPEFICMEDTTAGATAGETYLHVIRVQPTIEFETVLSEASASIARGAKYTIGTDAGSITATATNGVAEVVDYEGKAQGDKVTVRFA